MVPGPELGVLLAGVAISALTGSDVVEVLRARARQLSHDQTQLLAAMVEVGRCPQQIAVTRSVHQRWTRGTSRPGGRSAVIASLSVEVTRPNPTACRPFTETTGVRALAIDDPQ